MTYFKHYIDLKSLFFENLCMDLICVALVIVFAVRFLSSPALNRYRSKVTIL